MTDSYDVKIRPIETLDALTPVTDMHTTLALLYESERILRAVMSRNVLPASIGEDLVSAYKILKRADSDLWNLLIKTIYLPTTEDSDGE